MLEDLRWPTYPTRGVVLDAAVPDEARGGGALRVRDIDGNVYLDAVAGIGCGPLGHSHPLWCEAVARQLTRMTAASNTFNTVPQLQLVARLIDLFPVTDARAFLCSTGTEATEAAIKLALRATGRDTIVACERAFHGRTLGALSLTANPDYRAPYITCPGEPVEKPSFVQARALRFPYNDLDAARAIFEREGSRIAAVFATDAEFEILARRPSAPARHVHELPDARLVVVGSSAFASDAIATLDFRSGTDSFGGNLVLVKNLVDWAVEDTDLLQIRSVGKFARTLRPMKSSERNWAEALNYAVVLLALLVVGVTAMTRRRNATPIRLV